MKKYLFLFLTLSIFCSSGLSSREQSLSHETANAITDSVSSMKETAASVNAFGLKVFKRLASGKENVFISPYSVFTALGIAYAGATGATARQMKEALCISQKGDAFHSRMNNVQSYLRSLENDNGFLLKSANALWADKHYPFLKSYIDLIRSNYSARITNLDIAKNSGHARDIINKWIEEKTNHRIKNLLNTLSADATLVITNAVYFKAGWEHAFSKAKTKDEPFYPETGKEINIPMMTKQIDDLFYYENGSLQLVRIPYQKEAMEMAVILPKKGMRLEQIGKKLNAQTVRTWLDSASKQDVKLSLPRFKMEFGCGLNETLMAMGMKIPFTADADFSRMDGSRQLRIDQVQHKAFVEVDEKGTEAAAATAVKMVYLSARIEKIPITFKADRPFLFMIRDTKVGCFLFLGRVGNPKDG